MSFMRRILLIALAAMLTLSGIAEAQNAEAAIGAVRAAVPEAVEFWVYPSAEDGCMWVVFASRRTPTAMEGGCCFVTPDGVIPVDRTTSLVHWELFSPEPSMPKTADPETQDAALWPAVHIAGGQELMVSWTGRLNAWALGADGLPKRIDVGKLTAIHAEHGQLCGMVEAQNYDYAFLVLQEGTLRQAAAVPVDESAVCGFPEGRRLLDQLRHQGFALTGFLYRSASETPVQADSLGNQPGSIAVNLERDGQPWHTYFFCPDPGEPLEYIDGSAWGSVGEVCIAAFEGAASDRLDTGLETLETRIEGW